MPSFRWDHSRHLGLTVSRQGFLAELANTEGECDQVRGGSGISLRQAECKKEKMTQQLY
jgi:hypothetical protein